MGQWFKGPESQASGPEMGSTDGNPRVWITLGSVRWRGHPRGCPLVLSASMRSWASMLGVLGIWRDPIRWRGLSHDTPRG